MFDDRIQKVAITSGDWIRGALEAPLTVLEYADFECSRCGTAARLLREVCAAYEDQVRWVFRHFPMTTVHPRALSAAEAAEAAGAQGAFWPMHDLLFSNQDCLEHPYFLAFAEQVGIDDIQFALDLGERRYLQAIERDFRYGVRDGANGTPSIFIGGRRYDGPLERNAIEEALLARLELLPGAGRNS